MTVQGLTSADSVRPTGAWTPADALGEPKRMSTKTDEVQESHECPSCDRTFETERGVKLHHAKGHGESLAGVESICEWCGGTFRVKRAVLDDGRGKFCSLDCYGEYQKATQSSERQCVICGDTFHAVNSRIERGEARFCSLDCFGDWFSSNRTGSDHPNWKGGYIRYYGPSWRRQRRKALERDSHECQVCGADESVHVHHIQPFRTFGLENHEEANDLNNLVCLCSEHHSKWEGVPLRPLRVGDG